jgi:16S rRNA (uracil1498-N3)-methyltransferase
LFFSQNINGNAVLLDVDEVAHISNVLRFCENDEIRITDGIGNIFDCKIIKMKKDSALCEIISSNFYEPISCKITLAVGMPDKEKIETICEMLAPLGVKKIVPLITKNCQKNYSDERWQKVVQRCERKIISSIKQSLNPYVTTIESPVSLSDFKSECQLNRLADIGAKSINEVIQKEKMPQSICVFVGPPSGFSQEEINMLSKCVKISLGKYRLRSELAAISAAAAIGQFCK